MVGTFRVVWRLVKAFEVAFIDANLFLFKFASVREKNRVLEGASWSFDQQLLVFHDYNGDLRPSDYVFDRCSFWIRIYGLPMNLMSMEVAKRLGRKIGTLKEDMVNMNVMLLRIMGEVMLLNNMGIGLKLRLVVDVFQHLLKGISWAKVVLELLQLIAREVEVNLCMALLVLLDHENQRDKVTAPKSKELNEIPDSQGDLHENLRNCNLKDSFVVKDSKGKTTLTEQANQSALSAYDSLTSGNKNSRLDFEKMVVETPADCSKGKCKVGNEALLLSGVHAHEQEVSATLDFSQLVDVPVCGPAVVGNGKMGPTRRKRVVCEGGKTRKTGI
ncbi:hypothetical protein PTKIN_Ptkin19aG0012700 [Pterospermum kingtungense]